MDGAAELDGYRVLDSTATRDCPIDLLRGRGHFVITSCGEVLMSSEDTASERVLGRTVGRALVARRPRVLVGGLGMGITLRALLDELPRGARVIVAELLPSVVRWNRGPLAPLSRRALDDPRVRLHVGDVASRYAPHAFDAIVLDVDNGPQGLVRERNNRLYSVAGLRLARRSLRPGGVLALWSAAPSPQFERRLAALDFRARRIRRIDPTEQTPHVIYLAYCGTCDSSIAATSQPMIRFMKSPIAV